MQLSITYFERIMMAPGSDLVVTITGAGLENPVTEAIKTEGGPPYAMEIALPGDVTYPLNITAKLSAPTGHHMAGQTTLTAAPEGTVSMRISIGGA
jgi:hypothetical protein